MAPSTWSASKASKPGESRTSATRRSREVARPTATATRPARVEDRADDAEDGGRGDGARARRHGRPPTGGDGAQPPRGSRGAAAARRWPRRPRAARQHRAGQRTEQAQAGRDTGGGDQRDVGPAHAPRQVSTASDAAPAHHTSTTAANTTAIAAHEWRSGDALLGELGVLSGDLLERRCRGPRAAPDADHHQARAEAAGHPGEHAGPQRAGSGGAAGPRRRRVRRPGRRGARGRRRLQPGLLQRDRRRAGRRHRRARGGRGGCRRRPAGPGGRRASVPSNQSRAGCSHSISAAATTTEDSSPPLVIPVTKSGSDSTASASRAARERRSTCQPRIAAAVAQAPATIARTRSDGAQRPRRSRPEVAHRRLGERLLEGPGRLQRVSAADLLEDGQHDGDGAQR